MDSSTSTDCLTLDRRPSIRHRSEAVEESGLALPKPHLTKFHHRQPSDVSLDPSSLRPTSGGTAVTSIDSEIEALNREMQRIQLQYQEIVDARRLPDCPPVPLDVLRSPRLVPRMGTRLDYIRQLHMASEQLNHVTVSSPTNAKTSPKRSPAGRGSSEQETSAYNTGDSCRSTPAAALDYLRTSEDVLDTDDCATEGGANSCLRQDLGGASTLSEETAKDSGVGGGESRSSRKSTSRTSQTQDRVESLQALYNQYIDVMYTNKANLQHTIQVQQNLFQQQLARCSPAVQRNDPSARIPPQSPTKSKGAKNVDSSAAASRLPSVVGEMIPPRCSTEMEWVVKRRADGSRYITRRPVRNRMLKERARKLAEERCGLTTDDDAVSELKIGRYWSREERKRHLEKARNHKRQKEMLLQQQMESNREKLEARKELNAVELGHRKNLRHKSKKAFDDFTTVQELMVHGSREPQQAKAYNALLSVTTV